MAPYIDNMFPLKISLAPSTELARAITSNPPTELTNDQLMPKYNQLLKDRYTDTIFLLRQVTKQHSKFNHALNHIADHPNMVNDNTSRHKRGFFSNILISFLIKQKAKLLNN